MTDEFVDIETIARQLNERALFYDVGKLQAIRKDLRGFRAPPASSIFSSLTIKDHYAFHHGGRTELQFNIGFETRGAVTEFRHGVAFSFEPSQSLPDIYVLAPKVRLFNEYVRSNFERLADLRMWHHRSGHQSDDYMPGAIPSELVSPKTFVFLGRRYSVAEIDLDLVLDDFDRLLPLYEYVESRGAERPALIGESGLIFRSGVNRRPTFTTASVPQRELDVSLRHNRLQEALCLRLVEEHGEENVGAELPSGFGMKIDAVVRLNESEYCFYEIKAGSSARVCIREALGQILEYSYWPGGSEAARLVICGEAPLDAAARRYLGILNSKFGLPIAYEQITVPSE